MKEHIFSQTFFAMGTRCDIVITDVANEFAEQVFHRLTREVEELEFMLSRFIPESPVSFLNRAPKNVWQNVSPELMNIITQCFDYYQISNGAFDVTAGAMVSLWKNKKDNGEISEKDIEETKNRSGFDKLILEPEKHRLKFTADGVEFDFGAIGKGIALDVIKPILQKGGIKNAIVSFGESSILALGNQPNGDNWQLGIRNPFLANNFVHVFAVNDEIITTSGTILSTDEGAIKNRNLHIISPETGLPIEGSKTVSVKSNEAAFGEFISTTWLILPENDKEILSEQIKGIEVLEVNYLKDGDYESKLSIF